MLVIAYLIILLPIPLGFSWIERRLRRAGSGHSSSLLQGNNFLRILQGLGVTIGISILRSSSPLILGTIFGIILTSQSKVVRFLSRALSRVYRVMPQLVLLSGFTWLSQKFRHQYLW